MARRSNLDPEVVAFVHERFGKSLSHRAIVDALRARGTPLSLGTVHTITKTAPKQRKKVRAAEPPAPPVAPVVDEPPPADADVSTLRRWMVRLEALANAAEADGNLQAFTNLQRAMRDTWDRIRKAEPPAREDPNEAPDMVAAANRARTKLHEMLDRALGPAPAEGVT